MSKFVVRYIKGGKVIKEHYVDMADYELYHVPQFTTDVKVLITNK